MTTESIPNQPTSTSYIPVGVGYPAVTVDSPQAMTPVSAVDSAAVQASFAPTTEVSNTVNTATDIAVGCDKVLSTARHNICWFFVILR